MADYWKSTPKYWCKHCKQYVRDTPLEKRNHEASPRHQGNLQRFVKELHKTNAREEREAQRAKDEVARLNGVQPGTSSATKPPQRGLATGAGASGGGGPKPVPKATPEDRRRQMAQLAAMGVAVPDGFRNENAMAGDWETVAVHPTPRAPPPPPKPALKKEASDDDVKPGLASTSLTDRKRKLEAADGEADFPTEGRRKPNWGSDVKHQRDLDADEDLDALLAGSSAVIGRGTKTAGRDESAEKDSAAAEEKPTVKAEDANDTSPATDTPPLPIQGVDEDGSEAKDKGDAEDIGSMFKKRKKKALKHD